MNYRKSSDQNIFFTRNKLKEVHGNNFFNLIDQYPLYACPQTLLRYCKIYDLLKDALKIPGDICEFGTWKGSTALFMAKILNELEPQSKRKIIVFDTFQGLPPSTSKDGEFALNQTKTYQGDKKNMENLIDLFDLSDRFILVEGLAEKTIPKFFDSNNPALVSLAYFDFDLYEPTIKAWQYIKDRLLKGSILAFDEGYDRELWIGECKAVKEILNDKNFKYQIVSKQNIISRQPEIIFNIC